MATFQFYWSLTCPHLPLHTSMYILALWARSFHLHYPTLPLKHHDYEEDVPTSSQQMADHTAMIYDSMYPHGITACIYPIQFPAGQPAATLKVRTVWSVNLTLLTQCIYFTFFSSVLLLLWHILFYPPSALCHFLFLPLPFTSHSQRPPSCQIPEQCLTTSSLTCCVTVAAASSTTLQLNIPEHSNVHGSVHYPLLQGEVRSEKHVRLCHKWTMGIKRHPPRIEFQLRLEEGKAALFIHEVWLSTDEVPCRCHLFNCHNTGMSI